VHFDFPAELDTAGVVAHIRLEPEDELPADDDFFLNLDTAGALEVLLVESDAAATETLRPGFHLRTAVTALAQAGRQSVTLIARSPRTWRQATLPTPMSSSWPIFPTCRRPISRRSNRVSKPGRAGDFPGARRATAVLQYEALRSAPAAVELAAGGA